MGVLRENCLDFVGAESGEVDLADSVLHVEEVVSTVAVAVGEWASGGEERGVVGGGRVRLLVVGVRRRDEGSAMTECHWEEGLVTCKEEEEVN